MTGAGDHVGSPLRAALAMIANELKQLGLGAHEAKVYGALLEHSPAGASHIAKVCGLSRSSVYTTLAALTTKGLVATTYKNEVKQFVSTGPEALERLLVCERDAASVRLQAFATIREHLDLLQRTDEHVPRVMFFEGQEGLRRIYLGMLRDASPNTTMRILRDEFIWEPEWTFVFDAEWHDRVRRWHTEKNVQRKILVNPSKLEQSKASYYTSRKGLDVRFLPTAHAVRAFAMYHIGDTTAFLSLEHRNLIGIKIVNAHLAKNFERIFDALWDQSKQ